ncbi:ABC transporter permease [Streptomyces graminilatus]|uniref:ABC transporter permease n=1 Tax=Streptomyces graminilatus TaxID=1464070 RepID=UPI0018E3E849|nr:ABC transporter permease [Streptomyces graminilatus]
MLRLAWLTLRARKAGFVGAFTALALAFVLITACGVLLESALRSGAPTERYAAADVVIAGQQRITPAERVLRRLRALPGAEKVTAEVSFPAVVITDGREIVGGPEGGPSLGHAWDSAALAPYTLEAGRPPATDDEVVLDSSLADRAGARPGSRLKLATTGPPSVYMVVGVARSPLVPTRQAALFFSPRQAVRLAGGKQPVDAIGVRARSGVSAAELAEQARQAIETLYSADASDASNASDQAGELYASDVLTGDQRGEFEFADSPDPGEALGSFAGTFGAISLFVALFVVAATLALSVQQRMGEIGTLRAIAATPRQIRRMIASETLLVSLAACAVGCPAGIALAALLRAVLADRGLIPEYFPLHVGPTTLLTVVALVVTAAQLAVAVSARRASRVHPTQVLREASTPPPRTGLIRSLAGIVVLVIAAVALAPVARGRGSQDTGAADSLVMVLMLGVALLGPLAARVGSTVLGAPIARLFPVAGFLASAGTRAQYRRLAAAVTPLVLAISFSGTLLAVPELKTRAAETQNSQRLRADHVVRSSGIGLPADYAAEASRIPGVQAVTGLMPVSTTLTSRHEGDTQTHGGQGYAVDEETLPTLLDLDIRAGSLARLRRDTVALGERRAESLGVRVGDTVGVDWEDGTRSDARVVALYARDKGFADLVLPRELAERHSTDPLDDTVLLRTSPTADDNAVQKALQALTAQYPMADPIPRAAYDEARHARQESSNSLSLLLLGMIAAFTAIAVANTLTMSTMERTQEFAMLRLIGATRRHVTRIMLWEAGITVTLAVALGSLVCAAVLVPIALALTGSAVPAVSAGHVLAVLGGTTAFGLVTVLFTTRLALRTHPAQAIGTGR